MIAGRTTTVLLRAFAVAVGLYGRRAFADCECGYYIDAIDSPDADTDTDLPSTRHVFTDLLETNFLTQDDIHSDSKWFISVHDKQPGYKAGALGRDNQRENVVSNPLKNKTEITSGSKNGGDPGLQLIVRGGEPKNEFVPTAEVRTREQTLHYGSYRASIKLTNQNGTCGAFFWYLNDAMELDMEFLSKQFVNDSSAPVHLVLHSPESLLKGGDAAKTDSYIMHTLPFRPDEGFHEYRFDWTPGRLTFYADGKFLAEFTDGVPNKAGTVLLNHWSDGRWQWTGGPPEEDAIMTVSYFKAYFNTTSEQRLGEYKNRCKNPLAPGAVCRVPDQTVPPDPALEGGENAKTFFFVEQTNMTHGASKNAGSSVKGGNAWAVLGGVLAVMVMGWVEL